MTEDPGAAHAPASRAEARLVLGLLFVVYVFNFIDRQILSILIGPIQSELGVSDTLMGLLSGFTFAIFYTLAGIPIARLSDRGSRRDLLRLVWKVWARRGQESLRPCRKTPWTAAPWR